MLKLLILSLLIGSQIFAVVPMLDSISIGDLEQWVNSEAAKQKELNEDIGVAYKTFVMESFKLVQKSKTPAEDIVKLNASKEKCLEAMVLLGTATDFQRFNAFYEYRKLFFRISKEHGVELPEDFKQMKLAKSPMMTKALLKTKIPFLQFVWASLVSGLRSSDSTPTTKAADRFFEKQGEVVGAKVEFKGKLQISEEPKQVNVVVLNHVDGFFDAVTIAAFKLDSYLTFGALNLKGEGIFSVASNKLFSPIVKLLEKNKDVILLGQGNADPLQSMIKSIKEGRSNTVVLFPQGMISAGFDETLPVKKGFSEKVVRAFQNAGYSVNLQIVTSVDRFSKENRTTSNGKKMTVVIDPVIPNGPITKALSVGGDALDLLIRRTWIDRISENTGDYRGVRSKSTQCHSFYAN